MVLLQRQDGGGGKLLGYRADAKDGVGGDGNLLLAIGQAVAVAKRMRPSRAMSRLTPGPSAGRRWDNARSSAAALAASSAGEGEAMQQKRRRNAPIERREEDPPMAEF